MKSLFFCFLVITSISAQEFTFENEKIAKNQFYTIAGHALNQSEAEDYLRNNSFKIISIKDEKNIKTIVGSISQGKYVYSKTLIFKNNLLEIEIDEMKFIYNCYYCFASTLSDDNFFKNDRITKGLAMDKINQDLIRSAIIESVEADGTIDKSQFNTLLNNYFSFDYDNYTIERKSSLKLVDKTAYQFYTSRSWVRKDKQILVGETDISKQNTYDLHSMIKVFLKDCSLHGIKLNENKISVQFEELAGNIIALSYGMNKNTDIIVKVDPIKWEKSNIQKKWYILYHELGHDVLNLEHGNGGKMMFNFVDKGYTWDEFLLDKEYMLNSQKKQ